MRLFSLKNISLKYERLVYHLRHLALVGDCRSACWVSFSLTHALVTSRVDLCNSLFRGLTGRLLNRLNNILPASAKYGVHWRKFSLMQDTMKQLHNLPFEAQVKFKIVVLTFKLFTTLNIFIYPPMLSLRHLTERRELHTLIRSITQGGNFELEVK